MVNLNVVRPRGFLDLPIPVLIPNNPFLGIICSDRRNASIYCESIPAITGEATIEPLKLRGIIRYILSVHTSVRRCPIKHIGTWGQRHCHGVRTIVLGGNISFYVSIAMQPQPFYGPRLLVREINPTMLNISNQVVNNRVVELSDLFLPLAVDVPSSPQLTGIRIADYLVFRPVNHVAGENRLGTRFPECVISAQSPENEGRQRTVAPPPAVQPPDRH